MTDERIERVSVFIAAEPIPPFPGVGVNERRAAQAVWRRHRDAAADALASLERELTRLQAAERTSQERYAELTELRGQIAELERDVDYQRQCAGEEAMANLALRESLTELRAALSSTTLADH